MTATGTPNAYQLVAKYPDVRIYHCPRGDFFGEGADSAGVPVLPKTGAKSWTRQTHLHLASGPVLTSGSAPARAVFVQDLQPGQAVGSEPNNLELAQDVGPLCFTRNTVEDIPCPTGLKRWDALMVCGAKNASSPTADEECVYVGFIVDWELDFATGQVLLYCEDFRRLLDGITLWGERWYDERTDGCVFLGQALPVFNPRGEGNMYSYSGKAHHQMAFADPKSSTKHVARWSRGTIWNYLRRLYSTNPEHASAAWSTVDTRPWLEWPEVTAGGIGAALFETSAAKYEAALPQWALGGMKMGKIWDLLIRKRADLDWTPAYDRNTGKAIILIYGTGAATINQEQRRKSLRWTDIAQTPSQAQPEIPRGRLRFTAERTCTHVRGFGAHRRYDVTFQTKLAGQSDLLEPAWDTTESTPWVTAFAAEDETRNKLYPDVYLRWRVTSACDWKTRFGWLASIARRRIGRGRLESFEAGAADSDPAIRLTILAWRSKDSGVTWELAPPEMQPKIDDADLGIVFPEGAREVRAATDDADPETWTWNGNTSDAKAWEMKVTICVEADERLAALEAYIPPGQTAATGSAPPGWPVIEELLQDEGYLYAARREATLSTDGVGHIARGGQSYQVFGHEASGRTTHEADDVITDDSTRLQSAIRALASQNIRTGCVGDLPLKGLRLDIGVGDYIENIMAGGSAGAGAGTRPDLPVHVPVRSVAFCVDDREPLTIVHLESL